MNYIKVHKSYVNLDNLRAVDIKAKSAAEGEFTHTFVGYVANGTITVDITQEEATELTTFLSSIASPTTGRSPI